MKWLPRHDVPELAARACFGRAHRDVALDARIMASETSASPRWRRRSNDCLRRAHSDCLIGGRRIAGYIEQLSTD